MQQNTKVSAKIIYLGNYTKKQNIYFISMKILDTTYTKVVPVCDVNITQIFSIYGSTKIKREGNKNNLVHTNI